MFPTIILALLPLLDDRPPLEDVERFPPAWVIEEQLRINRLYREHLECRITVEQHQAWLIHTVMMETDRLYEVWDTLRWAACYSSSENRRDMLSRLRELLGPADYYAGILPPVLPLHRFVRRP